jgi:hypothetical protein
MPVYQERHEDYEPQPDGTTKRVRVVEETVDTDALNHTLIEKDGLGNVVVPLRTEPLLPEQAVSLRRQEALERLGSVPDALLGTSPWGPVIRDLLVHLRLRQT